MINSDIISDVRSTHEVVLEDVDRAELTAD